MNQFEKSKALLFSLCAAGGVSGDEGAAAMIAKDALSAYMETSIDALGNVRGHLPGKGGVHILLDAHIDRIGYIVTSVDESGFLKVAACGGMDPRIAAAQTVTVYGDQPYFGVIASTPPHLQKEKDGKALKSEELVIDIGMTAAQAKAHIVPGDRIVVNGKQFTMGEDLVVSPAIDDRAGVAVILEALRYLQEEEHNCEISVQFSVQEETTGAGATVGAYSAHAQEAIILDVSFAHTPELSKEKVGTLGGGPMIGIAPSVHEPMFTMLKSIAERDKIPYQVEVMGGRTGTNLENVLKSREGVQCGLISIPQKYMHTGIETVSLRDIDNCARLIAAYIKERSGACHA